MNRDIFISYSRKNYDVVMEIKRQIDAATGTECWIDLKGIESGSEQFTDDIIDGINNCKVFLFMLTEQSQESNWALRELAFAEKKKKHVVLVNIDGIEMNDRFSFKYGLTDTIAWNNLPQHDKLIRDMCRWIDPKSESVKTTTQSPVPDPLQALEERLAKLDKEIGDLDSFEDAFGKYGYKDKTGKGVIPSKWDHAYSFSEGLAAVEDSSGKCGFIDKTGSLIIPCKWDFAWAFREGLAMVKDSSGKWGFIDKTGSLIIPCKWDYAGFFIEGLAMVKDSSGKWGFIDKTGSLISPCKWDDVEEFSEGLAKVKDSSGKWGLIDKIGSLIIPCKWDDAGCFSEGLASVKDSSGKWGFIDKIGNLIIPCKWDVAWDFSEGLANVKDSSGKWHKIGKTGKVIF